jgi:hypothetical protein
LPFPWPDEKDEVGEAEERPSKVVAAVRKDEIRILVVVAKEEMKEGGRGLRCEQGQAGNDSNSVYCKWVAKEYIYNFALPITSHHHMNAVPSFQELFYSNQGS